MVCCFLQNLISIHLLILHFYCPDSSYLSYKFSPSSYVVLVKERIEYLNCEFNNALDKGMIVNIPETFDGIVIFVF